MIFECHSDLALHILFEQLHCFLFILFLISILISRYLKVPRSLFFWNHTFRVVSKHSMMNITVRFSNQNEKKCQDWVEAKGQVHVLTYNFPVEHSACCCPTSKHILADTFPSLVKYHIFPPIKKIAMQFFFKHYLSTA